MSHDVFLSYSTKDRLAANAACDVLERNGIRVWMAPRDILPGMSWPSSIVQAINSTRIMILIVSSNVNASPHIEREVERAINKGVPILPFRVEDVKLNDALEYFISTPHWLDAFDPPLEQHLERLVTAVQRLLETDYMRRERVESEPTKPDTPSRKDETKQKEQVVEAIGEAVDATRAPQNADEAARTGVASIEGRGAGEVNNQAIRTLYREKGFSCCVALAPDGKTALVGSGHGAGEGKLRLWDVASGEGLATFYEFPGWRGALRDRLQVRCVAFAPDGRTALSGSHTHYTIKLWDLFGEKELRTFAGHSGRVRSVAFASNGKSALSGSEDKTLKLWDLVSGQELRTFLGHTEEVFSVAVAPDGKQALSGSRDKTLKLWDLDSGDVLRTFNGHRAFVNAVAFLPNGGTALSASSDGTLKLWDLASGENLRTLTGHAKEVWCVAIAPNGETALSGSSDLTLKLWDLATGQTIRTFTGHTGAITSVAISRDGKTALSGGQGEAKLWDLA